MRERYFYENGALRDENQLTVAVMCGTLKANAHEIGVLYAHAPELADALEGVLGLITLIKARDDITPELRETLLTNHRVQEARRVLADLSQEQTIGAGTDDDTVVELKNRGQTITITKGGEVQIEGHFKSVSQELYTPQPPTYPPVLGEGQSFLAGVALDTVAPVIQCERCRGAGELARNDHGGDPEWDYAIPCPECAIVGVHTLRDFRGDVKAYNRYLEREVLTPRLVEMTTAFPDHGMPSQAPCPNHPCIKTHGHEPPCSIVPPAAEEDLDEFIF